MPSYVPNYAPRVRVEFYLPMDPENVYQYYREWLVQELTLLRGGCTVQEDMAGYYLSGSKQVMEDRVSVVYSDFPMDWHQPTHRSEVLAYCATIRAHLLENLRQEEILVSAYPVSHIKE